MDFLTISLSGTKANKIAYIKAPARSAERPGVIWMSGFRSQMASVKGEALAAWAQSRGIGCLRFDYSGHGQSGGRFEDCVVGDWLAESLEVFRKLGDGPQIVAASSMGAWLALLLARTLAEADPGSAARLRGLALLAPAWDMTEDLMWRPAPEEAKRELMERGVCYRAGQYDAAPYPITRRFIEEGRSHLIGGQPFDPGCPVRIFHGMRDADVPYERSVRLAGLLECADLRLTLVKDADHSLHREQDLKLLFAALADLCGVG
jgi:pimeloyl-ACP methyl ester carboxylesterase